MVTHSKRYAKAAAQVDRNRTYELSEAIDLLKGLPAPKFDESFEVVVRLGIDPRKTDQLVRGAVSLPNGLGKTVRVVVFAEGDKADAAKAAGADEVGAAELADKIAGGWTDFDVVITSPDMMKHVGRLGKVLGPQGKMPSPKSGTVTPDVATAVSEFKAGKVEFRTDSGGNVHAAVGKRSFSTEALAENLATFLNHLTGMRPPAVKGNFFQKISISTTMGPGVWINYGG
ncbi:MAG: 50S ribosomal protein L1 [Planctomycetes bacterium]|nr:50S ribosomal protein L1 [Planctomycetota bacterium]